MVLAIVLWSPKFIIVGLGLETFLLEYRIFLGPVFLIVLVVALTPLIDVAIKLLSNWWHGYLLVRQGKKRLQDLTPGEIEVLRRYILQNTRTQNLPVQDGKVAGLVHENILYRASNIGSATPGGGNLAHNIQPWAWRYLRENPGLLRIEEETTQ